jgi:hypothetical protein
VPDRVDIPIAVKMPGNNVRRNPVKLTQKFADQAVVGTLGDDLHTIAGGKDDRFGNVTAAD